MTSEIYNTVISAVTGAVAGGLVNYILEKRKEHREDKKEKEKEKKEIYENRPELEIIGYKNHISRPGHRIDKECDINIFLTKIEKVTVEDDTVTAHYNKDYFDIEDWCCVKYTFKNVGKTDIECINPICLYKKDTMLCDIAIAQEICKFGLLHYTAGYDKKLRVGETLTMKVCYHKDCPVTGMLSALMAMGLEDSNGRCWTQALFAPYDKIYSSEQVKHKEYKELLLVDTAIECFKKPWLW